jgi:hypothetical protein
LIGRAQKPDHVFVLPSGRVVGVGKPAPGGDLGALGLTGTNNYNDFWHSRLAYHEELQIAEKEHRSRVEFSSPLITLGDNTPVNHRSGELSRR